MSHKSPNLDIQRPWYLALLVFGGRTKTFAGNSNASTTYNMGKNSKNMIIMKNKLSYLDLWVGIKWVLHFCGRVYFQYQIWRNCKEYDKLLRVIKNYFYYTFYNSRKKHYCSALNQTPDRGDKWQLTMTSLCQKYNCFLSHLWSERRNQLVWYRFVT